MKSNEFDMESIIDELKEKRKIFGSEAEFQLELAWVIKETYPDAKVRLEYCPSPDSQMHIDILVIKDDKWYPIELKYKTKGCTIDVDGEVFYLKNQGGKNDNCYFYLKDINRIEELRKKEKKFDTGYTMFITNDISYTKSTDKNCIYKPFSLEDGRTVDKGILDWNAPKDDKKERPKSFTLEDEYSINWKPYLSLEDNSDTGTFQYIFNTITKK